MEENQYNTEELKQGAKDAFNDTKEALKNIDFKAEAKATEGFLKEFLKNPFNGVIQAVRTKGNDLTLALMLNLIWLLTVGVIQLQNFIRWNHIGFLSVIQAAIAPLVGVIVMAILILAVNKNKNKNLTDVISVVTITRIPRIFAAVISLTTMLSVEAFRITVPITAFASGLSIVLLYVAMREMSTEAEESKLFMIFAKAYALYFVARFALSFVGITI